MKKFKKFISLVLSCAIVLSLCIPAFAAETGSTTNTQDLKDSIYRQLESQNALDLYDDFIRILIPNENASHQGFSTYGDEDERPTKKALYGGHVYYSYTEGYETKEVSMTCLDFNNSYYYILSEDIGYNLNDITMDLLGFLPLAGTSSGLFSLGQVTRRIDSEAKRIIRDETNGYAMITMVYNKSTQANAVVLTGWRNHPWMLVDVVNPKNVQWDLFDYHDPFDY